MAAQCPNCGKPVRSGAKFCGFCGYVLSNAGLEAPKPAVAPAAGKQPPGQQPGSNHYPAGNTCPYCGKSNRPGVKFCASCGKKLSPEPLSPPPSTPSSIPEKTTLRRRPRIVTVGFLVGVFVIVCASVVGIVYGFGLVDQIFPPGTPTSIVVAVEEDTATPMDSTQTPSLTPESTATATLTITPEPSATLLPTITSTPTPEIVFEEDFSEDLDNWQAWENRPVGIGSDIFPPDTILENYLDLKGLNYDKVGVTSIQTITLASGMVIEFGAEVEAALPASLYFDWYPGEAFRSPGEIGPLYLEINYTEVSLNYQKNDTSVECRVTLKEAASRTYRLEFGTGWEVILYAGEENDLEEICKVVIDEPDPLFGRITFSGFGLVDTVIVILP